MSAMKDEMNSTHSSTMAQMASNYRLHSLHLFILKQLMFTVSWRTALPPADYIVHRFYLKNNK